MDMSTEIIAKELSLRNRRNAEVLLAVGLPLTRFGEERKPFIDYLMKNRDVKFVFEEKDYNIRISRVCERISKGSDSCRAGISVWGRRL